METLFHLVGIASFVLGVLFFWSGGIHLLLRVYGFVTSRGGVYKVAEPLVDVSVGAVGAGFIYLALLLR